MLPIAVPLFTLRIVKTLVGELIVGNAIHKRTDAATRQSLSSRSVCCRQRRVAPAPQTSSFCGKHLEVTAR
jgi:hypothetical protein